MIERSYVRPERRPIQYRACITGHPRVAPSIWLVNLTIGQLTPPVGVLLFVASSVSKVRLGLLVREVLPYVAVLILTLLVITYIPALSLWLPQALK